jgi:hypothetical protein
MSESLRNSTGSIGTVSNISKYAEEIERFISGSRPVPIVATDEPQYFRPGKALGRFSGEKLASYRAG